MAELTATGITIRSVDEILAAIEGQQLANIDAELDVSADTPLGQLNGIVAAALAELEELFEELYQSAYPDTASGQALSYIAALSGVLRQDATKATLEVLFTGTVGTVIPSGSRFYPEDDPESLFESTADATILEQGVVDYVGATLTAVNTGSASYAPAATNLVIETPITGFDFCTTLVTDWIVRGLDEETDSELRTRREQSLAQAGASTVDAIRADVLTVTGVDSCTVFENITDSENADGVPAKAIEVLVFNAAAPSYTDQAVADQIWASKPAGTQAYGNNGPHTVTDSAGNTHEVYFSEPTNVTCYVAVTLTAATDGSYITDKGVKNELAKWVLEAQGVGDDFHASDVVAVTARLTGVESVDITATFVDDTTSPNELVVSIGSRELATLAVANITVTST
jgi:uncharacterized phage protein gp47/JayE